MNFKKFISGVSALTIAASAFAGLAVTAGAAADTYSIVFGTAVVEDGVTTGVSPQTDGFTTNASTLAEAVTDCDATIDGAVLNGNGSSPTSPNFNFSTAATKGQVKFQTYVTGIAYTKSGAEWKINGTVDGVSKTIAYGIQSLPSSSSTIPLVSVYSGTTVDEETQASTDNYNVLSAYVSAPRNTSRIYVYDITINLDTRKVYCTAKARTSSSSSALTASTATYDLPENVTSITGLQTSRLGNNMNYYLDNIAFYNVVNNYDVLTAETATAQVSVDKAAAAAGDTVTATATAKEGYINPVISVKDANDNDVAVAADGTFTMPASNVTVTATAAVPGAATEILVQYKNSENESIADSTLTEFTDKYEGDTYSYSYPKYIVKNNVLYAANDSSYTNTTTLASGTTSVDVIYNQQDTGVYKFVDISGGNVAANYSGGSAKSGIGGNQAREASAAFTVPETGFYDVEVYAKGASGSSHAVYIINTSSTSNTSWNIPDANRFASVDVPYSSAGVRTGTTSKALTAGTTYYVIGNGSGDIVDYVLLKKKAYSVTVADTTNGTVSVDKATATQDETVTITAMPDSGYEVDTITVAGTSSVTVTNNQFTMPAEAVTVTVTFRATAVEPVITPYSAGTGTVYNGTLDKSATVATSFTADLSSVTGTVQSITVTPSAGEARTFNNSGWSIPSLSGANVVLGIIVDGLADEGAAAAVNVAN